MKKPKKKKPAYEAHVYLCQQAYEKVQELADKENRSINNMIETIILRFIP